MKNEKITERIIFLKSCLKNSSIDVANHLEIEIQILEETGEVF